MLTTIGVYDWEQEIKQKTCKPILKWLMTIALRVKVTMWLMLDYSTVSTAVLDHIVTQGRFLLVERVAEEVAELIMTHSQCLD